MKDRLKEHMEGWRFCEKMRHEALSKDRWMQRHDSPEMPPLQYTPPH